MIELATLIKDITPVLTFVGGGIGVKIVDKILNKRSESFAEAEKIRAELRVDLDTLRDEVTIFKREAEEWRDRYYTLQEEHQMLRNEFDKLSKGVQRVSADFEMFKNGRSDI